MQKRRIGVGTLFRNSQVWHTNKINQVGRFFSQLDRQTVPNKDMLVAATIGKSEDNTERALMQEKENRDNLILLHDDKHIKTLIASTTNQSVQGPRIKDLSYIANTVLDELMGCDYIFWQESDLILPEKNLMESLIASFDAEGAEKAGIVAPLVYMEHSKKHFYDTWGFRSTLKNREWWAKYPHTNDFRTYPRYIPMNSIGSCCMMKGELLRDGVRFGEGAFVELCTQVRERDYKIYADKKHEILHPSKIGFIQKRWI